MSLLDENIDVPFEILLESIGYVKLVDHNPFYQNEYGYVEAFDVKKVSISYCKFGTSFDGRNYLIYYIPKGSTISLRNVSKKLRKPLCIIRGTINYRDVSGRLMYPFAYETRYLRIKEEDLNYIEVSLRTDTFYSTIFKSVRL